MWGVTAYMVERLSIMPPTRSKAAETRKALREGVDMLRREGCPTPSLAAVVWRLLQDAAETEVKLRDPESRYRSAGDRISWPTVVHTELEQFAAEVHRSNDVKMSKEQRPLPRQQIMDTTAEARMHTVLGWLRFVRGMKVRRDQKAIMKLAGGASRTWVRNYFFGKDASDSAVQMAKQRVVNHIVRAIEALKIRY